MKHFRIYFLTLFLLLTGGAGISQAHAQLAI